MMTDPIADMLTRFRNAMAVNKKQVTLPFSKVKFEIAKILKAEGYIAEVEKKDTDTFADLVVTLKYNDGKPGMSLIKRISKPGRRVYRRSKELPVVLNNYGVAIISTSKGIMTNKAAKTQNLGGEIICEIY